MLDEGMTVLDDTAPGFAPSGEQWEIRLGGQRAVIVEVGGGVRSYTSGDRAVLQGYPVGAMCDGAHGAPLIPWPNRLEDGRYAFDGTEYTVAVTEPAKNNAIHGFLRWRPFRLIERRGEEAVTVGTALHPMPGYPFALEVRIEYSLSDDGLRVATTARNVGDTDLPYAHGQHPYLSPGAGPIDECVLEFDAATRIVTDPERQLPTGREATECTDFDFRGGRMLRDLAIDYAFTDLGRDVDGRAWTRLTGADGRAAELWVDGSFGYVELFTGDTLAPARRRTGLGVEPMTAPPNAFATGQDVIRVAPGDAAVTVWGARLAG